ncbi:MAG: 4Fe-4S dicluster domain-containing protein [Bacillota bacterium]|nr:4Fe-4S dicluster domain-containing protein [Bacillota bacterium]
MKKLLLKEKWPELWTLLAHEGPLYLPVEDGSVVLYQPWQEGVKVNLEAVNSTVSPKDIFLPREETYLHYSCRGEMLDLEDVESDEPVTAFALHPCDLKAIEMIDRVFLNQDPPDALYKKRRENTTVVALACRRPDPYCFCGVFGIDPTDAPGADVMAYLTEKGLLLEGRTAKGKILLDKAAPLLEVEADETNITVDVKTQDFGLQVGGLPEDLQERFNDPVWDDLFRSCLGCGICTYVCPTCYCFDVEDYGHEEGGERFRCWDSCMFGHFTQMAGGHNPRPSRKERVRQRFMHKLCYYPETYGEIACVGCGRCLRSCPVNLDIVQAIKVLGGGKVG